MPKVRQTEDSCLDDLPRIKIQPIGGCPDPNPGFSIEKRTFNNIYKKQFSE